MKTLSWIVLIGITGALASCGGSNNKTSDTNSLTTEITGTYARESTVKGKSTYDGQPFTSILRDTIIIIPKSNGFEVQDRHWTTTLDKNNKPDDPNGTHGNEDSFIGVFSESDTTIAKPSGGSVKFIIDKHQLYPVGHPNLLFTKIK